MVSKKDRVIAEEIEGIDCIIGGHSHTEMDEAEYIMVLGFIKVVVGQSILVN